MSDALVRWQSLGAPPGGADRIVSVNKIQLDSWVEVSVSTNSGEIYIHPGKAGSDWQAASDPRGQVPSDCAESILKHNEPSFNLLPGPPKRCASVMWSWEWTTDSDLFVILEDGSVWRWHINHSFSDMVLWQCVTPLVFVGIGWIIYIAVRRMLKR
jgi:hypothetical protein